MTDTEQIKELELQVKERDERIVKLGYERDEMRKQMLEELGRADILAQKLDAVHTDLSDILEGSSWQELNGNARRLIESVKEKAK